MGIGNGRVRSMVRQASDVWRIFAVSIHANKRINGELTVRRINTDEEGVRGKNALNEHIEQRKKGELVL